MRIGLSEVEGGALTIPDEPRPRLWRWYPLRAGRREVGVTGRKYVGVCARLESAGETADFVL